MRKNIILILLFLFIKSYCCEAQVVATSNQSRIPLNDSTSFVNSLTNFPNKFFNKINRKTSALEKRLSNQTKRHVRKIEKQEMKLKKDLFNLDSNATKNLFLSDPQKQYSSYLQKFRQDSTVNAKNLTGEYLPYVDSLRCVLSFLNNNPNLLSSSNNYLQTQNSISKLNLLQEKMQSADQIKQYMNDRKDQIKVYLLQFSHLPKALTKNFNDYNKEFYYYNEQIREYKQILNDPDKLFQRALLLLNKLPIFQTFMKQNSILASMFQNSSFGTSQTLSGFQTRDEILKVIQSHLSGMKDQAAFNQNIMEGQSQLNELKNKIMNYGQAGGDIDIPNFKPQVEKLKTFFQRLEYGINIQTQHSSNFLPTTTDLAFTVGYKINTSNTVGIGASYKTGWGKDINHIHISSQGVGLRSYLDIKMKKSFYASGGFEYNYQPLSNSNGLENFKNWQQSELIGISKIISIKTKLFKKTKIQLLWDFLSYQQNPISCPFKFRIGYGF